MAFTHLSLAISLLLLSFLTIASAGAYDNYDSPKSNYQPKPEGEVKPVYGPSSDVYKQKPDYDNAKLDVDVEVKSVFDIDTQQSNYQVKPEGDYSGYDKPETEENPTYEATSSYDKKPEVEGKPNYDKPVKDETPEENETLLSVGVEGVVLCKSGSKYYPIPGALAKVTCQVDEFGVEKTLPICSVPTDAKGYFFSPLSSIINKSLKIKDCKAFLERSPLEICKVPSDVNKGITGAPFSAYRVLHDENMKLFSVGPFFFTSDEAQPAPTNGYQPAPNNGY